MDEKPDKREAIINAAIKTFAQNGYYNTKISEIATEANIADGTIYLYFDNKEDLLAKVFEYMMDFFIKSGLDEVTKIEKPTEKLNKIIEFHLKTLGQNKDLAVVFQIELRHNAKFMSQISKDSLRKYFEIIANVIVEGQKNGEFRKDIDPFWTTKIIFGALDEMATNWVLSQRQYKLEDNAQHVSKVVLKGISAK